MPKVVRGLIRSNQAPNFLLISNALILLSTLVTRG